MLYINIFEDYKVTKRIKGASISQEDSTPTDIYFNHYDETEEIILNGGKLIDELMYRMQFEFMSLEVKDDEIIIEQFNPSNGEGDTYYYKIERVIKGEDE